MWVLTRALALALGGLYIVFVRGNVFYDVTYYGKWAFGALTGTQIPYHDFAWEYPPLALPFMMLPGFYAPLFHSADSTAYLTTYTIAWVLMALAVDALVLRAIMRFTRNEGPGDAAVGTKLWLYGVPLLGALSWTRFDLLPAAAAFLCVFAAGRDRVRISGVAAGAGAALKIWPLLLAPIQRTRRRAVESTGIAALLVAAVAGITFVLSGSTGFAQVFAYQSHRGLQVESLAALPIEWLRHLGLGAYDVQFRFGAYEVVGPHVDYIAHLLTGLLVAAVGIVLLAHWRLMRGGAGRRAVALSAVTLMLVVILTNKVFSPQYMLWLLAVVVAAAALDPQEWRPCVPWVLASMGLTQIEFPMFYGDVVGPGGFTGLIAMTVRDAIVLGLLVWVVRAYWRELRTPSDPQETERPFHETVRA